MIDSISLRSKWIGWNSVNLKIKQYSMDCEKKNKSKVAHLNIREIKAPYFLGDENL